MVITPHALTLEKTTELSTPSSESTSPLSNMRTSSPREIEPSTMPFNRSTVYTSITTPITYFGVINRSKSWLDKFERLIRNNMSRKRSDNLITVLPDVTITPNDRSVKLNKLLSIVSTTSINMEVTEAELPPVIVIDGPGVYLPAIIVPVIVCTILVVIFVIYFYVKRRKQQLADIAVK